MTIDEQAKINEYAQRQREWRDISVNQLSNTNNILLTLSSGLLALCFNKEKVTQIHFITNGQISWSVTTYVISIILLAISMTYGIAVLFSRLYDFRISRHLALSRQRFYKKHKPKNFSELDFEEFNFCHRLKAMKEVLFYKIPFLSSQEIKKLENESDLRNKFNDLRKTSEILGTASWIWTKIQALFFLSSCLAYFIYNLLI